MKKQLITDEKLNKSKENLKKLRKIMIAFDIVAIIILILQIIAKDISYSSFIVLIICNIITFTVKPSINNVK